MRQKFDCNWLRICAVVLFSIFSLSAFSQKVVTGKVISGKDNNPVGFATVTLKGTKTATATDANGNFSLSIPAGNTTLVVSAVGYANTEVDASSGNVSVVLTESTASLNEIVVTGYTAQKKKDITGAVAVVDVSNFKSVPSGSGEQLLQGQASGVTVTNSGLPGGGTNIRIRGITTLGNTNPLVLIDGTPGSLQDIDVNDIASIQVLKDAGAAAIYGIRGSNGVIVVTTRKGRQGSAKVDYDAYIGTQRPLSGNVFDIADPAKTAQAITQSYLNDSLVPKNPQYGTGTTAVLPDYLVPVGAKEGDPNTDPSTYKLYTNQITRANKAGTDWFHEIFKPALIQSHTVTASGGSDRSTYLFSLGYFDQQGTLTSTYLKRYSVRANTSFNIKNHIRVGENAYMFYKQSPGFTNQNEGNAISYTYREDPIIPVYDIMGNYAGTSADSHGLGNPENPVAIVQRAENNKSNDWQILGNVFAEADFLKHFTIRTSFGGNIDNYYYYYFNYTAYENAENNTNPNQYSENAGYNSSWIWTNTLQYNNTFGKHTLTVLGGVEAINNFGRSMEATRSNYYLTNANNLTVDPSLWTLNFGPAAGWTNSGYPYTNNSLWSQFGRLDYTYDDKYILSGTLRRDGSSIFAPAVRETVFPSVSAGWRISREEFMKDISWINDLKIRGGWGSLGSLSNASSTNQYTLFTLSALNSQYDIAGVSSGSGVALGAYNNQLGNPPSTWEKDIVSNIGLDGTLFGNHLDFSIEGYEKKVNDLLFQAYIPATAGGATPPYINAGNIQNKGIDASITYHASIHRDLKLDITGTFTSYNNEVKSLPPGKKYYDETSSGSSRIGAFTRLQPGEPVGEFFGYQVVGLFQSQADIAKSPTQADAEPGRFKYADVNHDGKIDVNDRTFFGNPNPKFTTGLNIGLSYKNFDLSAFFYASVGNKVINYVKYWTDFPQVFAAAISNRVADNSARIVNSTTGQPTTIKDPDAIVANPDATIPLLEQAGSFSSTQTFNSYYMENGSYLRCKSLVIGYTIPSATLKKVGIDRFRVYVQAANLFTITKYDGLDPELQASDLNNSTNFGIDFGNYPANQKNYNIGVNLSF